MARVLFLQDTLYEAFGPEMLSAVLKADGHDCELLVVGEEGRGEVMAAARRFAPDVAAFSVPSFGVRWAVALAGEVRRELGVVTVFGGPHCSCFPDFAGSDVVDLACVGEGEGAIVDIARAVDAGEDPRRVDNLLFTDGDGCVHRNPVRPLIADLDSLPFQDRELYYRYRPLRRLSYKLFMAGRGCPYDCSYCFNSTLRNTYRGLGPWVRRRSPGKVVEEILQVRSRHGLRTLGFVDDTFTTDRRWLVEFCDLFRREVGLPFNCIARINEVDEEVAEALGRAGCHFVSFAVETGSEELRREVLDRRIGDEQIRRGAALLRRQGIKLLTCNMFGLPGETVEDGIATLRLNAEIGATVVGTSVLQPMPGTRIREACVRQGLLADDYDPDAAAGFAASSPLTRHPHQRELGNLQQLALVGVRLPWTIPLLRRLAKLPPNPLYRLVYLASMFLRFKLRCRVTLREAASIGMRSLRRYT